jgi:hypothetical protein
LLWLVQFVNRTVLAGPSSVSADQLDVYEPVRQANAERFSNPDAVGGPEATGPAVLDVVDADEPPLRLFFGKTPLDLIKDEYAGRIETWEQWSDVSNRAHGPAKAKKHA